MHVLRSKDVSQVYFDVVSHMAIVVNKIIRPIAACVVPHMLFLPPLLCPRGRVKRCKARILCVHVSNSETGHWKWLTNVAWRRLRPHKSHNLLSGKGDFLKKKEKRDNL